MSILLDLNTLPAIFNSLSAGYAEYEPIRECVLRQRVKIPFGGTKFKKELGKCPNYLKLYAGFARAGQIDPLEDSLVDQLAAQLVQTANDDDFDDEHLIAILIQSRCRVICTNDKRAMRFIKMKALYPKGSIRPRIYSGLRNRNILRFV